MPPAKKKFLFLTSKSPWASAAPAACVDVMLTAAVFDQLVSVVFCADGVYQLVSQQNGSELGHKTLAQMFPALELYDITNVYVEAAALQERGLTKADLLIDVSVIANEHIQTLIADSDTVFVF